MSTWSKGASDVVLRMTVAGGFVPPGVDQTNVPVITVYGDGRVISPGPQIMIYPGPLLPSLQVQKLDEAGMRKLLDAAEAAGLLVPDITYPQNSVADAPTTFFTLTADGCTHHVNADALMEDESGQGLDQKTIAARIKLGKFRDALADLTALVGKDSITDGGVFEADSFRIIVREDPAPATASGAPAIKWPLATPLAKFGEKLGEYIEERCGVVDGTDATKLVPLFQKANAETHWSSGGKSYYLRVRPLLPDESGCGDKIV